MSSPKEGDLGIIKPPSTTSTLAKSITTTNDLMPIISHDAAAGRWGEPVDSEEGPVSLNEAINEFEE